MVMVVLAFAVLVGFAGLAMDSANIFYQKTKIQSAVDAACLAGAMQLDGTVAAETTATTAATTIAGQNGPVTLIIDTITPSKIRATASRDVPLYLLTVLGFTSPQTVAAHAAAELVTDPCFDYAIFSGGEINTTLILGGSLIVHGSTWSNDRTKLNGSHVYITGNVYSSNDMEENGSPTVEGEKYANVNTILPMPTDIMSQKVLAQATTEGHIFAGPKTFSSGSISGAYYINGDVNIEGTFIGTGTILATGNITIGDVGSTGQLGLIALGTEGFNKLNGDRTIDAILYAPNGSINGNGDAIINGNLIVKNFSSFNGNLTVYGTSDITSLPKTFSHLCPY